MIYVLVCLLLLSASSGQECQSSDDGTSTCGSSTLLLDELFPSRSLDEVWEDQPLLSTVYQDPRRSSPAGFAPIPTVVVPDEVDNTGRSLSGRPAPAIARHPKRFFSLLSLFSVMDIDAILNQPGISHKDDFLVVRKVIRDGEEWMGQLPQADVPYEKARRAFELGGFSLVINALQRRWRPIANLVRQVRNETGCNYCSMNLYLTPDTFDRTGGRARVETDEFGHVARRNAFEYHWDWMDVIVLQISGTKLWSVSRAPTEYLSPRDMKRKPTLEEVDWYLSPVNETTAKSTDRGRYDDFMLRPGDALYIPRGYIHNASTVSPTFAAMYGGDGQEESSDELQGGPSLHLTVGIEAAFETTCEALVHHALAAWGESNDDIIIPAFDCGAETDVRWETFLHFAAGDVARRKCNRGDKEGCILRRSVPRGAIWEDRVAKRLRNDDRKDMLLKSIRNIGENAIAEGAAHLATLVVEAQNADTEDHDNDYYIPVANANDIDEVACIAGGVESGQILDMKLQWDSIHQFANEHFDAILTRFEERWEESWESDIQKDEVDLHRVGQIQ